MKNYIAGCFLLFFAGNVIYCQDTTIVSSQTSHEIWTEMGGQMKLGKNWKVNYNQSIRFSDKTGGYKLGFTEYGIQYKLTDAMALKLKGRFTFEPGDSNEFKYYFDYAYNFQRKGFPLRADYRFRLEDSPNSYRYGRETYVRNRVGLSYNLTKFADPFVQYEIFYCLDGVLHKKFSDHRFYGGIQWTLGKNLGISTAYFFDKEIQDVTKITKKGNVKILRPDKQHTFVIEVEYNF
jgi:hypothetical protein